MLYRSIHLKCNPDYAQFISSASNAVVVVKVLNARMCDINDRVTYWCSKDGIVPNLWSSYLMCTTWYYPIYLDNWVMIANLLLQYVRTECMYLVCLYDNIRHIKYSDV